MRRIINSDEVFHVRLEELKADFIASKYPIKLVENIFKKVKELPRTLEKKDRSDEIRRNVILTSTHGRDTELKTIVEESCKPYNIPVKYVSKTAATLKNRFSN